MKNPTVSVIIPAFNRANYICKAIDSVLDQTYQDFEIVVIDDGSTDDTKKRLERYKNKIRYFFQKNKGISAARNAGIKRAKGTIIALLDSDDWWDKRKLELQLKFADEHPDWGLIDTFCIAVGEDEKIIYKRGDIKKGDCFNEFINCNTLNSTSSVIIKKDVLDKVGGFDPAFIGQEDYHMWIKIAEISKIYTFKKYMVYYFHHPGNISGSTDLMMKNSTDLVEWIKKTYKIKDVDMLKANHTRQYIPRLFKENRYDECIQLYKEVTELDPDTRTRELFRYSRKYMMSKMILWFRR